MKGATYYGEVAQAVVDIERIAGGMNRRRVHNYRDAAIQVWNKLPAYIAPVETGKSKTLKSVKVVSIAGKRSRAMERYQKATEQILSENERSGPAAIQTASARLLEATVGMAAAKLKTLAPDEDPAELLKSAFVAMARQILAGKKDGGEAAIDSALSELHAELETLGADLRAEVATETETESTPTVQQEEASLVNKNNWTQTGAHLDSGETSEAENSPPTAENETRESVNFGKSDFRQVHQSPHLTKNHLDNGVQILDRESEHFSTFDAPLSPAKPPNIAGVERWSV
jgi:hypothetical protein